MLPAMGGGHESVGHPGGVRLVSADSGEDVEWLGQYLWGNPNWRCRGLFSKWARRLDVARTGG